MKPRFAIGRSTAILCPQCGQIARPRAGVSRAPPQAESFLDSALASEQFLL